MLKVKVCHFPYTFNVDDLHKAVFISLFNIPAAAAAKSLQLCPTLCDPIDGSLPGSPDPGILQAITPNRI